MEKQLLENLPIILISVPLLITLIIYTISYRLKRHKWRAIHMAVQGSAVFYVIAVTIFLQQIFKISLVGYMLIFIILILTIILIIQWKKKTEVMLFGALKVLWRILFLLFFVIYIGLLVYLLIVYALSI